MMRGVFTELLPAAISPDANYVSYVSAPRAPDLCRTCNRPRAVVNGCSATERMEISPWRGGETDSGDGIQKIDWGAKAQAESKKGSSAILIEYGKHFLPKMHLVAQGRSPR